MSFDRERATFRLIASRFDEPSREFGRVEWGADGGVAKEATEAWANLPPVWLGGGCGAGDRFADAYRLRSDGTVRPLSFDWYTDPPYDHMYIAPSMTAINPLTGDLLVGMGRVPKIIVCDPETGAKKREVLLESFSNSSKLLIDEPNETLWAIGYDTLFCLSLFNLQHSGSRLLEERQRDEKTGMMSQRFAGRMVLQPDLNRLCVSRPFSGDVVAVDARTLDIVATARTGGQPLSLAVVDDLAIVRTWKTGELRRATLRAL